MVDYYNEIKNKLIDDEVYRRVKDYSKERHRVMTYYEIGKLLNEAGGKYGDNIIGEYAKKLSVDIGTKYNRRTLFRMKKFYSVFSNEKVSTLLTQLTWSHYLLLLPIKDYNKIIYYINTSINKKLTQRQLQEAINNKEYERLPNSTKNKLINKEKTNVSDLVKNPIIIKKSKKYEIISEKILKQIIIDDIESFMRELGNAFSFIGSEYRIKIGNTYNYIDLLLFNYEYNCFVVVELKVTELKKEHIGQIQVYMNYIDNNLKRIYQDKTIGIIICKEDNQYIIKYSSDDRILSRTYELVCF